MGSRSASTTLQHTLYRSPIVHVQRTPKWQCERVYSTASVIAAKDKESDGYGVRHPSTQQPAAPQASGLERLPTWALVRNLMLGSMFTSPFIFRMGFGILDRIANSRSSLLNPDANPVLRAVVKPLIYDQFCAGTNQREIFKTRDFIRGMGYAGVILCYGKEIQISKSNEMKSTGHAEKNEIEQWKEGNLQTLDMVGEGDWLGIKLTGAGTNITNALINNADAPPEFITAMDAICERAASQNCRLWIDAEQQVLQTAIDRWTIDMMRKWNTNGRALVFNTLQAYLKASRQKLQHQLSLADKEGWTLAVKLVRGAYIANDQREKIHDTKPETDASYNSIVKDILQGTNLGFSPESFPKMTLFLAGHNPESVAQAWNLTQTLSEQNRLKVVPDFGQLQGMADELGCKLLQRCDDVRKEQSTKDSVVVPNVYRCLTWGSIQECMQYLLRRLVENRGGADRMRDGMADYWAELKRRTLGRSSV